MSDYGVDAPEWRALPWEWAGERLTVNRNYWVVTVSAAGQPHALPVWGVWHEGDHRFMFSCSPAAAKARHIADNPRVAVAIDDTVECVSVQGLAAPITDRDRLEVWIERYVAKYGNEVGDDFPEFVRAHAAFEVTPTVAFAVIERADEFALRATRWRFDD